MTRIFVIATLLLLSQSSFGQAPYFGEPEVLMAKKIMSAAAVVEGDTGIVYYINERGQVSHHHYHAETADSTGKIISGMFGKVEFEYDVAGNVIRETGLVNEPPKFQNEILRESRFYYDDAQNLVKKEFYDGQGKLTLTVEFEYQNGNLVRKLNTKSDSAMIMATKEKFMRESVTHEYDTENRVISRKHFRESTLVDSATVKHEGNKAIWNTHYIESGKSVEISVTTDDHDREVYTEYKTYAIARYYTEDGLLDRKEKISSDGSTHVTQCVYTYR